MSAFASYFVLFLLVASGRPWVRPAWAYAMYFDTEAIIVTPQLADYDYDAEEP